MAEVAVDLAGDYVVSSCSRKRFDKHGANVLQGSANLRLDSVVRKARSVSTVCAYLWEGLYRTIVALFSTLLILNAPGMLVTVYPGEFAVECLLAAQSGTVSLQEPGEHIRHIPFRRE